VGFATAYFCAHTVHGLFHQWLARLDRTRFEVVAIHLGGIRDAYSARLPALADEVIEGPHEPDAWVARIGAAELDALVWLDVGMHGLAQTLSPLRFAPVTAVAWGHPVTTGLESVDAFLSAEAMEPDDAARHYTEPLVPLSRLGIRFPWPLASRDAVRVAWDGTRPPRLVCAQTVYKLHPRNLDLVTRIAARLPDAEIHFVPHPSPDVRARFAEVVRTRFEAAGAPCGERVRIHPGLKHEAFLALLAHADVFLDMPGWSGGHTTLEAIATDLPFVTLPGAFMRQRHTHAMASLTGLADELSVDGEEAYVARVVRLATDPADHAAIVARIRERKWSLYDDDAPIRALEAFLLAACGREPKSEPARPPSGT
ncbi:MAG TPA: hypothetical protein VFO79_01285, partial [Xanthomonadales bacterium]|nr:hypothetical protein [Xanthomonadales bacterium]